MAMTLPSSGIDFMQEKREDEAREMQYEMEAARARAQVDTNSTFFSASTDAASWEVRPRSMHPISNASGTTTFNGDLTPKTMEQVREYIEEYNDKKEESINIKVSSDTMQSNLEDKYVELTAAIEIDENTRDLTPKEAQVRMAHAIGEEILRQDLGTVIKTKNGDSVHYMVTVLMHD